MPKDLIEIYVTALKNTHALEQEALQIMKRQVDRIEQYPEMAKALEMHIEETEVQRERLELALEAEGEKPSALKETVMGLMGNVAAIGHMPAGDEVLKNSFANHAFENYEIAAYQALITIAEEAGRTEFVPDFKKSLQEEKNMAKLAAEMLAPTTLKYLKLAQKGEGKI